MKLRDLINEDQLAQAETALVNAQSKAAKEKDPIILKVLTGISAWVASLFLLGFIIIAIKPDGSSILSIGLLLAGFAITLHYTARNAGTFVAQSTLSCMMCGHVMLLFGIVDSVSTHDELLTLSITQTLLCALPIWVMRRSAYQASSLLFAAFFWTCYAVEMNSPWLFRLLLAVEVSALAALTLWRARTNSFGYALALAIGATIFFLDWVQSFSWHQRFDEPLWPTSLIMAAFVAAIGAHFLAEADRKQPKVILLFIMLLAMAFLSSPGLLFTVALLILGYGLRDRIFGGLGLIGLPTFIIYFYYSLQVSLLEKSGILFASGIICLLIAYVAQRSLPKNTAVKVPQT